MSQDPDTILDQAKAGMEKALSHTNHEFATLHTGKANPSMVEGINIQAYGSSMRIRDVAAITTPDTRTIQIQPWDKSVVNDVKKGIETANLGFNPSVDGNLIRINIPELSKERRADLVKLAHNMGEEGRVGIRAARHDAMNELKKLEKEKALSEDDLRLYEKEVQKLTDDYTKQVNDMVSNKESELMQV
jgi:ribosome recycling factor